MKRFATIITLCISIFAFLLAGCSQPTVDEPAMSTKDQNNVNSSTPPHTLVLNSFDELDALVALVSAKEDVKNEYLKQVDEMKTGIRNLNDLDKTISKISVPTYISIESDAARVASIEYYPDYDYVDITYHESGSPNWNIRVISYMYKTDILYEFSGESLKIGDLTFNKLKSDDENNVIFVCTDTKYPISLSATKEMEDWCINNLGSCATIKNYS